MIDLEIYDKMIDEFLFKCLYSIKIKNPMIENVEYEDLSDYD